MQRADGLVVGGERLDDLPGLLELGIHPLDRALVGGVLKLCGDPAQRDVERLDIALQRQVHLRRRNGGFLDTARQDGGETGSGVADEIGNGGAHRLVKTGRRIGDAGVDVIVVDEGLVVLVAELGAGADHVGDEAHAVRHLDLGIAVRLDAGVDFVPGLGDAPFHGAVDDAFGFGLAGVEGLDRVGVIVAEHAEGIGGLAPAFLREEFYPPCVPFLGLAARAAPFAFGDVEDVILEVLELGVRRLGAFQQVLMVDQEQRLPRLALLAADQRERIERNIMVRGAAAVIADHAFEQGHGRVLRKAGSSVGRDSAKMVNALLTPVGPLGARAPA